MTSGWDAGPPLGLKSGFARQVTLLARVTTGPARLYQRNMPESIQDRVLRVIATTKRIPLESVQPDSTFESLSIDSLDRLNILFDLESEFDIEIDDEDAKQVSNIPQMVQGISAIIEARAAGLPVPHFPRNAETPAPPVALPSADVPGIEPGMDPDRVPPLPPRADE